MKMTQRETWYVEYSDFDEAVNATYGITNYEFVPYEESSNDVSHEYWVNGEMDDFDVEEIATRMIPGGDYSFLAATILNDMANKNLIPTGHYVISVSW